MSETITAISTAPGEGGIGIVRISGDASMMIMKTLFAECPEEPQPRYAYFGHIVSPKGGNEADELIDEAVWIYSKAPASYTGEDMLEIQAHGSNVVLRKIIHAITDLNSVNDPENVIRLAEPGEFTKLAFMNGKMDLSQAEAVIDIIRARTNLTLGIAEGQKEGRLSAEIGKIRQKLLRVLAQMAVNIDYPDEDIEQTEYEDFAMYLHKVRQSVDELLETSHIGRIARDGLRIAIVGRPNVGKSSLMNALLGEGRAIVTDIPGTTRDTIEESATIAGFPIVLVDTAGIRETDDKIEQLGILRTENAVAGSDMVILVIDGSNELTPDDQKILSNLAGTDSENDVSHVLVILNKKDLGRKISPVEIRKYLPEAIIIRTSLAADKVLEGIKEVENAIAEFFDTSFYEHRESNIVTSERHIARLKSASDNLGQAIEMLRKKEPVEVAELSAHYAYDALGEILGEAVGDEILDEVFSKFCLGK